MEQLAVRVENEYRRHGDWQFLRGKPDAWFQLVWPPSTDTKEAWSRPAPFPDQTGVILRIALFDEQDSRLLGTPAAAAPGAILTPVLVDALPVAWSAMAPLGQSTVVL